MGQYNVTTILLGILLAVLVTAVVFIKRRYRYWQSKGVYYLQPEFLFGNSRERIFRKIAFCDSFHNAYKHFKENGVKHGGLYSFITPVYMPLDIEVIKDILTKDFDSFRNRGLYVDEENDPLSGHLFNLEDTKWKLLRNKLSPTFTSGKLKIMFETFLECTIPLQQKLNEYSITNDVVDIKELLARFTTDVIGSCAFGIQCNSVINPDDEFRKYGKRIFESTYLGIIKNISTLLFPKRVLHAVGFSTAKKDVEKFFLNVVKETIEYRKKNNISRRDFLQLLIDLENPTDKSVSNGNIKPHTVLTFNEQVAQCFVFFIAGFETSSTTMTFALYELANNPDVQDKLREDINHILSKHNNEFTYECFRDMNYLDNVIYETLRKYPPVSGLFRVANANYKIPGTDIIIDKGTRVHIPVLGIQMDSDYYPDPEKFDPDRFTDENKSKRPAFSWLPFGEGPRICIGMRFGMLQSKVGLAKIIKDYRITLNSKTKTPLVMDRKSFFPSTEGGMWLNVNKIQ